MKSSLFEDITPKKTLARYAVFAAAVFWGLILLSRILYPARNSYSVMHNTFSCLGSLEEKHNPSRWWIFSLALGFWGFSSIPLAAYIYARFRQISVFCARTGFVLLLAGCAGIIIVGLFPYGRITLPGGIPLNRVHDRAAAVTAGFFIAGILWHAGMLSADALKARSMKSRPLLASKSVLGPYILFFTALLPALYFRIKWRFVYAEIKFTAETEGASVGSAWGEALGTIYSFPLWQHICIAALFIFMLWLPLSISKKT